MTTTFGGGGILFPSQNRVLLAVRDERVLGEGTKAKKSFQILVPRSLRHSTFKYCVPGGGTVPSDPDGIGLQVEFVL